MGAAVWWEGGVVLGGDEDADRFRADGLRVGVDGHGVATVTFDRPAKRNAITPPWPPRRRSPTFPRPTLAVLRGACVGGGCQLAVACDLRLAEPGARLGITPAKLGVVYPAVPTARLARLVGPARAKFLLYSAELGTAERAAAWGLVDEVVPGDRLADRVTELARTIAGRSRLTLGAVKDVVAAVATGGDPQAAVEPWERRSRTAPDVREGLTAFVERRPPRF